MEKNNVMKIIVALGITLVIALGTIVYLSVNKNQKEELNDKVINNILDTIEMYAQNGYLLKDTTGDVIADKLTLEEAKNSRETYEKIIRENIDDTSLFAGIYFKDNKFICECYFENLLNKLGIGTHMGAGTNINEEGIQIFVVK